MKWKRLSMNMAIGTIFVCSHSFSAPATHWAYELPVKREPPVLASEEWGRTEIDRFILAPILAKGLSPARNADRETLIRRVYFDLTGLPPTPKQVERFRNDRSAEAYSKVVDGLLASPRFGERWGRHWLDVARFAESVTLRGLVFPEAWRYRDYVIDSFNQDIPFDRFIKEQIAGDLMPRGDLNEKQRARIATTYLVLGNINYEEQDKEQLRMDIVDEQLDTIGKGLLAQTLGCARCHDHKFDPIPTRDYYAMAAILRNTKSVEHANVSKWIEVPLPLPAEEEEIFRTREKRVAQLQDEIRKKTELLTQLRGAKVGASTAAATLAGVVVDDSQAEIIGEWKQSQFNQPYIERGYVHDLNSGKGSKTLTFHPAFKSGGDYEVRFAYTPGENRATRVPVTILHAAGETTVHVNERTKPPIESHFVSLGKFQFEAGNQGYVLVSNADTDGHVVADAVQFLPMTLLESIAQTNTAADKGEETKLKQEIEELRQEAKRLNETGAKRPMVMSVTEEKVIEETQIHIRGSVHRRGEDVSRGFLQVVNRNATFTMPAYESGRVQLAEWIASTSNPLTARVFVNRAWAWLFGTGIVRTPDNFGTTGEHPSNLELLDWLAIRFMEEGWSMKKLVREMVLSRTYQLVSVPDAELLRADPENRLFARMNRRRLDAETIRDTILNVSGALQFEMGGVSFESGRSADFGYIDQSGRRSVYVPIFRNALPSIFQLFDFADTSVVTGERNRSVVSPQALYFLNDPWIMEQAHRAAERFLSDSASDLTTSIQRMYHLMLGRAPTDGEVQLSRAHLERAQGSGLDKSVVWAELFQAAFASLDFRYLN
jgi:hypothetical protein